MGHGSHVLGSETCGGAAGRRARASAFEGPPLARRGASSGMKVLVGDGALG